MESIESKVEVSQAAVDIDPVTIVSTGAEPNVQSKKAGDVLYNNALAELQAQLLKIQRERDLGRIAGLNSFAG
jgi:hypothetical protein